MNTPELNGPLLSAISVLSEIDQLEPLSGGFSPDDSFLALRVGVPRFVLRLGDAGLLARKQAEWRALAKLRKDGVLCPEPIDVGLTHDGSQFYTVAGYIPGREARDVISGLTEAEQAAAGRAAGEQLRIIHEYTPPDLPSAGWQGRRVAKHQRKLAGLKRRGLFFDGQERIDEYLATAWDVIEDSPFRFQHDDLQLGNIIIAGGKYAGVIDFGNWDTGDPAEDFYKIPWHTALVSVPFACGQIDGYLDQGEVPEFWARYNLFVALALYSSLLWADETKAPLWAADGKLHDGLAPWRERIAEIIETHDFNGGGPPSWFVA